MRIHVPFALATALLLAADAPPADQAKADLKKLQGRWQAVSLEANGEKAPDEAVALFTVEIKDNKITFTPESDKRESVFELDTTKTPKQIVVTPLDGPRKGQTLRGIYAFDKKQWKLCVDNAEGRTPTEFETKAGDGRGLLVFERQKSE